MDAVHPSLSEIVPRRSKHTIGTYNFRESSYVVCNAQPRQAHGQDLHEFETMEQRIAGLMFQHSALPLLHYRDWPEDSKSG